MCAHLTLQHLVVHSLLAGDDQVELVLTVLKTLRSRLDALIALQHVQDAILCISEEKLSQGDNECVIKTLSLTHTRISI